MKNQGVRTSGRLGFFAGEKVVKQLAEIYISKNSEEKRSGKHLCFATPERVLKPKPDT